MEGSDILQTIAEVAIALTGFTGIVFALSGRTAESISGVALIRFRILLIASLVALALALLPFFVHYVGASPGVTWSVCSAVVLAIMVPVVIHDHRAFRTYSNEIPEFDRRIAPLVVLLGSALWVVQVANVFILHDFAPYLAAALWFLGFSALQFTRLLLAHPK